MTGLEALATREDGEDDDPAAALETCIEALLAAARYVLVCRRNSPHVRHLRHECDVAGFLSGLKYRTSLCLPRTRTCRLLVLFLLLAVVV